MSSTKVSFSQSDVIAAAGLDPNFRAALPFILDHEGMVLENVPGDPGGATCCGITHFDYDAYRHQHGLALHSLGQITPAEVAGCYREHYWQPLQCGKVPFPVAMALFDSGVLCGNLRAIHWLQIELGVTVDGVPGQNTLAAVGVYVQKHGASLLATKILDQREQFHRNIASGTGLSKFLKGWLQRVKDLKAFITQ